MFQWLVGGFIIYCNSTDLRHDVRKSICVSHCAVSRFMAQGVSHHASTRAWRGVRGFVSQNILAARKYSGLRFNESFNWIQRTERRGWRWRWRETRRIPEAETAARRWLGAGAISTQFLCFIPGCSRDSLISWARFYCILIITI